MEVVLENGNGSPIHIQKYQSYIDITQHRELRSGQILVDISAILKKEAGIEN